MGREEQQHDANAMNRRWRPALMSFFLRRVHHRQEAEDLTQEVFARVLNNEAAGSAPDVYIFQIAQNLLVDRSRRARVRAQYRESVAATDLDQVEVLDPLRIALGRAELARFASALDHLPERTRSIFTLYRLENVAQDAIGEAFGISVSAVKKQVAKAMSVLMQAMREER